MALIVPFADSDFDPVPEMDEPSRQHMYAHARDDARPWDAPRLGNVAVWVELALFTLAPALGFLLCSWGF